MHIFKIVGSVISCGFILSIEGAEIGSSPSGASLVPPKGDNAILCKQMLEKMDSCAQELKRLEREYCVLQSDKRELRKTLDGIVVPEFRIVTNVVRLASGGVASTVTKVNYKQDARVRRLVQILKNPLVQKLYGKYCDSSCVELLEEFKGEWKMAQESYAETKDKLNQNNASYSAEIRRIDQDAKRKYEADIQRIDEQISEYKRLRTQSVVNRRFGEANPPQVAEYESKIAELTREKSNIKRIYDHNKYVKSYAQAGSSKTDANDAVLASADYRNQLQSIFMVYNNRVKVDLFDVINKRITANRASYEAKNIEHNRLKFFVENPDMINAKVASAIIDKQVGEAINELFKVDVKQMDKDYITEGAQ